MTYQSMSDFYHDEAWRKRSEMCIREQAMHTFVIEDDAQIVALANGVIASNWVDIESIMAAIATHPDGEATVTDDASLQDAVVAVWPKVAKARYPQLADQSAAVLFGPGAPPAYLR